MNLGEKYMNRKILSGSSIKIIALISMVIDHFGQIVLKNGIVLNAPYQAFSDEQFAVLLKLVEGCHIIGRIAFPLFCFLLVEGFLHTHNLKKYILQLGIFAVLSEPIYDLAVAEKIFSMKQQNVLFTLLLGIITLAIIKKCKENIPCTIMITIISSLLSFVLHLDGWYYGILLIVTLYVFHNRNITKYTLAIVIMFLCGLDFSLKALLDPYFITAACSLIIVNFYSGERGIKLKYFFYAFYPIHLIAFYMLATYVIVPMF
ncbi:MAG: TraX family protein [Lachnospiraceae bacterium]